MQETQLRSAEEEKQLIVSPLSGSPLIVKVARIPLTLVLWAWSTAIAAVGTFGRFLILMAESTAGLLSDVVRLRLPLRDTIAQSWFMASVSTFPAVLISIPFGVIVSVQVGSLASQVGASSVAGAAGGLGVIRQGAPMVAGILLGGAVGAAIAADLGARTIREEVDALRTMGLNPNRRLVAPRLAAMTIVAPFLCILIIFVGIATGYVTTVVSQGGTPGAYFASFSAFATVTDLIVAIAKSLIFGFLVVCVASQRGLEAQGGPKGVADAVNATVVIGVMTTFAANVVITQILSIWIPTELV